MHDRTRGSSPHDFGVPLDSALARRERLADDYAHEPGSERIFPELTEAVLAEVPESARVLEVGAATGLMTEPLLGKAKTLTALEPSVGMLTRLLAKEVASSEKFRVVRGMVEDMPRKVAYDVAVVTFTPRRGFGLVKLLQELAVRVRRRVVMMLPEDGTMDWAYLSRSAAVQGFDVRSRIVCGEGGNRAVVLVAGVENWTPAGPAEESWATQARETTVPVPSPRGVAARLVRFFLLSGDRALLVRTDREWIDRLHGNLRTAAHRLGAGEITVRREDDGVLLLRLPKHTEE